MIWLDGFGFRKFGTRTLGWAVPTESGSSGHYFPAHSFGHTGFTGHFDLDRSRRAAFCGAADESRAPDTGKYEDPAGASGTARCGDAGAGIGDSGGTCEIAIIWCAAAFLAISRELLSIERKHPCQFA